MIPKALADADAPPTLLPARQANKSRELDSQRDEEARRTHATHASTAWNVGGSSGHHICTKHLCKNTRKARHWHVKLPGSLKNGHHIC